MRERDGIAARKRGRDAEDVESHCSPAYQQKNWSRSSVFKKILNSGQVQSTLSFESMSITLAGCEAD